MAIPVLVPGEVLTAELCNDWFVPNAVTKPSDQSVTSSTVMVSDTALVLPVAANAAYIFACYLDYEGGTNGSSDIKWQWSVPSGATLRYTYQCRTTANAVDSGITNGAGAIQSAGTNGAANLRGAKMDGTLITVGTSGNLQLQWAQNTSSGTATIVHAQSSLTLQRTS